MCTSFYNKLDLNRTDTEIISCLVQTCNRHQCICQRMVIWMSPIIKPYDPIINNYHYLISECLMNDYSAIWVLDRRKDLINITCSRFDKDNMMTAFIPFFFLHLMIPVIKISWKYFQFSQWKVASLPLLTSEICTLLPSRRFLWPSKLLDLRPNPLYIKY